eukprot:TRINITY_DN3699_c0_g2_i1.p1 TRINITY_DN3699_c0_g2~~TRINITY_DN3699_c0_g2_i1.p1  ORF type:complete len:212 (-),score=48.71 TRINITY_DN3699_c0_g2_i1:174-779(-)
MAGVQAANREGVSGGEDVGRAKPKIVNLADPYAVKRQLDDVASEIILSKGYKEDESLSNLKISLGFVTCAVALAAQLYPKKFPENRPFLLACIALYVILNLVIQFVSFFKEKNYIVLTHPVERSCTRTGLAVSSKMSRCSDTYTLRIESADPTSKAAYSAVEFTRSVTSWFCSDGTFAEDIFEEEVEELLEEYESDSRKKK